MLGEKKKSSHRLSSLFSVGSSDSQESKSTKATTASSSESSGRLTKVKKRISSATHLAPEYPPPPPPKSARDVSLSNPTIQAVEPAASLEPLEPPPTLDVPSRGSSPSRGGSRPGTPNLDAPSEGNLKKLRRKSRLFGGSQGGDGALPDAQHGQSSPLAWIVGHHGKVPYNLTMLLNGEKVPELWDDTGDTFVYLFPRTSNKGPSFRIDSSVYAASQLLTRLVHGSLYSDTTVAPPSELAERVSRRVSSEAYGQSRTASPDQSQIGSSDGSKGSRALSDAVEDDYTEKHLYMPIALSSDGAITSQEDRLNSKDADTLVTYRNFFAFLIGQSLVATERQSDIFDIFLRIGDILSHYAFSNVDGSSFGEVAASSFDCYVDELALADVRHSREKTIEAIVLGEKMRSLSLYTEGFVHAAGKFDSIKEIESPKFAMISHKTATRLARAAMDLDNREATINGKLKDFEFPNIFAGIMNSAMASEGKIISFKKWRHAFMTTRSFVMDYYKTKYGSWLPKAKSKKNNLTTSGLNRLVLLEIYRDMSNLYDLLVDRKNLTNRTADGFLAEDEGDDIESVVQRALRKVLSEYDRSTPPVQPPVPFDLPLYPVSSRPKSGDAKKDAKARSKKLNKDDVAKMLKQSHNIDAEQQTPFLEAFQQFELKHASGATMDELWDLRSGQWLFVYAVIQSLPMLVVDAPGVRFTEGVEYFLCEVPRSGVPWGRDDTTRTRTWFGVAGGAQVVSLPTDVVEHGVEGVFRRSHCWKKAQQWAANDTSLTAAMQELNANATPLPPPPGLLDPASADARSRSRSPDRRRESVMNLGLEALPLPPGVAPPLASSPSLRPASSSDPSKTFDAILGTNADPSHSKDKKKKK
ncbi:Nn.00g007560.m01.CDS01 [Neocucurbitaria sp. VM-36]